MLSTARNLCVGALFILLFLPTTSWAQADSPAGPKQNWDISVWIAGETGEEVSHSFAQTQILTGGVFVGRAVTAEFGQEWRRGALELGADLIPLFVQFRPDRRYGGGFEPVVLRWNSSLRRRFAPYIEIAGGGTLTNLNLPVGNTSKVNFTARAGIGIQLFRANRRSVDIGCRWSHISNANLGTQNPGFNGIQVSLGYHWHK
jgi:hypothetical protein